MKVAVIGAGLGGLLAANLLLEKGFEVDVYERLPFVGGRFTSIRYKGFEVSTGALHMIPHGSRGPLGQLLKELKADVEIVDSEPEAEILWNGERYPISRKTFPVKDALKFYKEVFVSKFVDRKLSSLVNGFDEFTREYVKAFVGWSLSVYPEDIKFSKFYEIAKQTLKFRGPGIPIGGCKAVVEALKENVESLGGKINLKVEVRRIKRSERVEVLAKEPREYDFVVSNVGHKLTMELMNEKYAEVPEESRGIKYTIKLKEPFVEHTGVLFTPGKKIAGMNEVTNADPNLGDGVFLQAHQPFKGDVKREIEAGLRDLREILRGYEFEVVAIQSYRGDWPVNRIKAGSDIGFKTSDDRIVVVGDGAKGSDIEVDGIALGVLEAVEELEKWT